MATFETKYTIGEELGKGAYATVYRCTSKATGHTHAVKIIDKSKAGPKDISDVLHEVNMMKSVAGHPGVVTLYEFFDTPGYMYLVLELVEGGMLFDRIVAMKHYSEASASVLIKNFLIILQHIHSKGIIHRDLKPENLLLKHAQSASDASCLTDFCVADFGLAGVAPGQTCCGSPSYIAPEVINVGYLRTETTPYDTKADIWSVGVIAYILLSGKMPFHGRNFKETFAKIVKGQWAFVGDVWEGGVSPQSKDFIMKCLTMDPKARPSATEALNHPWVANVQSDMHLAKSIEAIRQFNAERKLRAAMLAFRATTGFLGHVDKTPPFMKYLQTPTGADKYSTRINAQSQTHPDVVHQVDYSKALDRVKPGWNIRQCCTCGSAKVCRHIQNVYDYLFNGRVDMDVAPFVNELLAMREDAQFDLEDDPNNAHAKMQMAKVDAALTAARLFREEYCKVPNEEKKPNFFAMDKPSGASVSKAAALFKRATA